MEIEDEDVPLSVADFRPAGGSWGGVLFDNPTIGLVPSLTWSFDFRFEEVERRGETALLGVTVEWVPLPPCDWRHMVGLAASATVFAEPLEASVYYYEHHRFDEASVQILKQDGGQLLVRAVLAGDIDGLGIPRLECEQVLRFDGLCVSLSDVSSADQALARLQALTGVAGLVAESESAGGSFRFVPV